MIDHAAVILDLETKRDAINTTIGLLRELYGMPATNGHRDPPAPTKPTKRTYRRKAAPDEPPVDSTTGHQSPLQDAVRAALEGSALTSIDTYERVKQSGYETTSGSVYSTLRLMLAKGLLVKGRDDIGTTIWRLK